ncbi:MAG: radical SAM/SPASM domain-containing protein [Candidatus Thorarchaeota archaeon]|jgi:MoaA/NifB/PqqE/SkfB family radical SAM enzyme
MVDVELTNRCNYRCVMCPTGQKTIKRETGDMDYKLYLKLIEEIAPYSIPIRFIRWGEPMLYEKLIDAIIEAKTLDCICHINTNGSLMNTEWADFFVKVGLDSIKFSFQGVDEKGYRYMRNSPHFTRILRQIKMLHYTREFYEAKTPFIQIGTTLTHEQDSAVEDFKNTVDSYTDAVYIGSTRDLQCPSRKDQYCECPEVFDKLSINWDGTVSACCGDYDNYTIVGDFRNQTLKEIWDGEPLHKMRQMLLGYRHNENHLCARCARSLE